jgi:hypothetical protein
VGDMRLFIPHMNLMSKGACCKQRWANQQHRIHPSDSNLQHGVFVFAISLEAKKK